MTITPSSSLSFLVYTAPVVDFPGVDKLLATSHGDLLRVRLAAQCLVRRLNCVQSATRARNLGCQVADARCAGDFKNLMRDAETESYSKSANNP